MFIKLSNKYKCLISSNNNNNNNNILLLIHEKCSTNFLVKKILHFLSECKSYCIIRVTNTHFVFLTNIFCENSEKILYANFVGQSSVKCEKKKHRC